MSSKQLHSPPVTGFQLGMSTVVDPPPGMSFMTAIRIYLAPIPMSLCKPKVHQIHTITNKIKVVCDIHAYGGFSCLPTTKADHMVAWMRIEHSSILPSGKHVLVGEMLC